MHPLLLLQLLALLILANGTPVIGAKLFGGRFAWPLDGDMRFLDGRRLLGRSKTVRGIVLSILVTTAGAPLIGLAPETGAIVGSTAMAGDLFSSFIKRRADLPPSSRATLLDQIPESLFPLLACGAILPIGGADIALGVAAFTVGEIGVSRVLYRWKLRDRPY